MLMAKIKIQIANFINNIKYLVKQQQSGNNKLITRLLLFSIHHIHLIDNQKA